MWGCPHFWREIHPHLHHRIFYECRTVIGPGLHFRQLSALFGKVITSSPPNLLSLSGRSTGEIFQKRSRSLIRWTILDQANDESFWPWKRNGELFNRQASSNSSSTISGYGAAYQNRCRIPVPRQNSRKVPRCMADQNPAVEVVSGWVQKSVGLPNAG